MKLPSINYSSNYAPEKQAINPNTALSPIGVARGKAAFKTSEAKTEIAEAELEGKKAGTGVAKAKQGVSSARLDTIIAGYNLTKLHVATSAASYDVAKARTGVARGKVAAAKARTSGAQARLGFAKARTGFSESQSMVAQAGESIAESRMFRASAGVTVRQAELALATANVDVAKYGYMAEQSAIETRLKIGRGRVKMQMLNMISNITDTIARRVEHTRRETVRLARMEAAESKKIADKRNILESSSSNLKANKRIKDLRNKYAGMNTIPASEIPMELLEAKGLQGQDTIPKHMILADLMEWETNKIIMDEASYITDDYTRELFINSATVKSLKGYWSDLKSGSAERSRLEKEFAIQNIEELKQGRDWKEAAKAIKKGPFTADKKKLLLQAAQKEEQQARYKDAIRTQDEGELLKIQTDLMLNAPKHFSKLDPGELMRAGEQVTNKLKEIQKERDHAKFSTYQMAKADATNYIAALKDGAKIPEEKILSALNTIVGGGEAGANLGDLKQAQELTFQFNIQPKREAMQKMTSAESEAYLGAINKPGNPLEHRSLAELTAHKKALDAKMEIAKNTAERKRLQKEKAVVVAAEKEKRTFAAVQAYAKKLKEMQVNKPMEYAIKFNINNAKEFDPKNMVASLKSAKKTAEHMYNVYGSSRGFLTDIGAKTFTAHLKAANTPQKKLKVFMQVAEGLGREAPNLLSQLKSLGLGGTELVAGQLAMQGKVGVALEIMRGQEFRTTGAVTYEKNVSFKIREEIRKELGQVFYHSPQTYEYILNASQDAYTSQQPHGVGEYDKSDVRAATERVVGDIFNFFGSDIITPEPGLSKTEMVKWFYNVDPTAWDNKIQNYSGKAFKKAMRGRDFELISLDNGAWLLKDRGIYVKKLDGQPFVFKKETLPTLSGKNLRKDTAEGLIDAQLLRDDPHLYMLRQLKKGW